MVDGILSPAVWHVGLVCHTIEFAQTSAILAFYFRIRFRPDHRSLHVILHQSAKFYPKNDVMSIFMMAGLRHLGFNGSNNGFFEKPMYTTSYRSSMETIALNCLVFEKIAFFCILATDRRADRLTNIQTDGQARRIKPLSLSRAAVYKHKHQKTNKKKYIYIHKHRPI